MSLNVKFVDADGKVLSSKLLSSYALKMSIGGIFMYFKDCVPEENRDKIAGIRLENK